MNYLEKVPAEELVPDRYKIFVLNNRETVVSKGMTPPEGLWFILQAPEGFGEEFDRAVYVGEEGGFILAREGSGVEVKDYWATSYGADITNRYMVRHAVSDDEELYTLDSTPSGGDWYPNPVITTGDGTAFRPSPYIRMNQNNQVTLNGATNQEMFLADDAWYTDFATKYLGGRYAISFGFKGDLSDNDETFFVRRDISDGTLEFIPVAATPTAGDLSDHFFFALPNDQAMFWQLDGEVIRRHLLRADGTIVELSPLERDEDGFLVGENISGYWGEFFEPSCTGIFHTDGGYFLVDANDEADVSRFDSDHNLLWYVNLSPALTEWAALEEIGSWSVEWVAQPHIEPGRVIIPVTVDYEDHDSVVFFSVTAAGISPLWTIPLAQPTSSGNVSVFSLGGYAVIFDATSGHRIIVVDLSNGASLIDEIMPPEVSRLQYTPIGIFSPGRIDLILRVDSYTQYVNRIVIDLETPELRYIRYHNGINESYASWSVRPNGSLVVTDDEALHMTGPKDLPGLRRWWQSTVGYSSREGLSPGFHSSYHDPQYRPPLEFPYGFRTGKEKYGYMTVNGVPGYYMAKYADTDGQVKVSYYRLGEHIMDDMFHEMTYTVPANTRLSVFTDDKIFLVSKVSGANINKLYGFLNIDTGAYTGTTFSPSSNMREPIPHRGERLWFSNSSLYRFTGTGWALVNTAPGTYGGIWATGGDVLYVLLTSGGVTQVQYLEALAAGWKVRTLPNDVASIGRPVSDSMGHIHFIGTKTTEGKYVSYIWDGSSWELGGVMSDELANSTTFNSNYSQMIPVDGIVTWGMPTGGAYYVIP